METGSERPADRAEAVALQDEERPHERLLRLIRRALGCPAAVVWEADGDRFRPVAASGIALDAAGERLEPRLVPSGLTERVSIDGDPGPGDHPGSTWLRSAGFSAYLAARLGPPRPSRMFVCALDGADRVWTDDDRDLLGDLADATAARWLEAGRSGMSWNSFVALGTMAWLCPTGMYVFNLKEMRPTYINQSVLMELGYSAEDVLALGNRTLQTLLHPDDFAAFPAHLANLYRMKDGERSEFEMRLKHADGGYRWFLSRSTVLGRDADGVPTEMMSAATNIDEFKRTTRLLTEAHDQFRTLAEVSPVGIARTDLQGVCVYVNQRWSDITGMTLEEARGGDENWRIAIHPDDYERLFAEWMDAVAAIRPMRSEFRFRRGDGGWTWVLGQFVPEYREGSAIGFLGTLTDVTALREAEAARLEERRRYEFAADASIGIFYDVDVEADAVEVSAERLVEFLGNPPERFEPKLSWWIARIHPDDRRLLAEEAARLSVPPGGHYSLEYRVEHGDGTDHWVWDRGAQFAQAGSRGVRRIGCVIDVTEQKRAARDLELKSLRLKILSDTVRHLLSTDQPREFLSLVFDELSKAVDLDYYFNFVVADDGARLRLASSRGLDEATVKAFEYLDFGSCACGVVALDRCPLILDAAEAARDPRLDPVRFLDIAAYACFPLMAGDRLLGTLAFASKSRERFQPEEVELIRAVCDQAGLAMERLQLLEESRQQAELLRENDRRKNEFLAMLAHELRNPLAAIQNAANVLALPTATRDDEDWASDVIGHQVANLARMIGDLLDISRITRGKIRLRKKIVDLRSVIDRAVEASRLAVLEKDQTLEWRADAAPLRVLGDASRLEQILVNLLDNAAKYSNRQGRIAIDARIVDGVAEVRVKDDGVGISEAMLPRIFDLFTQIDASLDRSDGGLGIGLALVRRLAQMHGGSIQAVSDGLGRGSEFILRLPTVPSEARPDDPAVVAEPEPPQAPARSDFRSLLERRASTKVLVVDDNVDLALGWSRMLRRNGFQTFMAHDGPAAISEARLRRPDVLLLDIGLPGLSGYDLAERLIQDEHLTEALYIAATGYGQAESVARATTSGFHHHLIKPVDVERVVQLIDAHLAADAAEPTPAATA